MTDELRDEEVFAAADAVMASGRRVTVARVLEQLGRGNQSHIGSLLDPWWEQFVKRLQADPLPGSLRIALNVLWNQAIAYVNRSMEDKAEHERKVYQENRKILEKAFAQQRLALERTRATEQQAFDAQLRKLTAANELMRERLKQLRIDEKAARKGLRCTEVKLKKVTLRLSSERVAISRGRRRDRHDYELVMHTLIQELRSNSLSPSVTIPKPDERARDLWSDFRPFLASVQSDAERRITELQGLMDSDQTSSSGLPDQAREEERRGKFLVLQYLLDELRRQSSAYREMVRALDEQFTPLLFSINKWPKW